MTDRSTRIPSTRCRTPSNLSAFRRLLSLLDEHAFADGQVIRRETIQPLVIRSAKRQAVDAEGKQLFKPRRTSMLPVEWLARHKDQRVLYEAVSEYVREGYNHALQEKRNYIGFLMILMQRLVTSSTRAVRVALERRLEALKAPESQLSFIEMFDVDEWSDLDGESQFDTLIRARFKALKNEHDEVKLLLEAAKRVEREGPDAKAEALLELIYKLQQEEGDPDLKILLFTEFVPTQAMLADFLEQRGFIVAQINGSMDLAERVCAQREFASTARVLLATDAGGEGLNLQFCHVVVNYDLPWNPMKLEQRIGRVDRIGQAHTVRAINFALHETVEYRVREVLEAKLAVIFEEFGVDKTGDVLDSADAGQLFDEVYVEAIRAPLEVEARVGLLVDKMREQAKDRESAVALFTDPAVCDPEQARRLMNHPLPHWLEQMTVNYLVSHGGQARRKGRAWHLTWPDGVEMGPVVFNVKDAVAVPTARQLTLDSRRIRELVRQLPPFVAQQSVPVIEVRDLPPGVTGVWSLWRIELHAADWQRERIMPLFLQDDGQVLQPTARHVWDQLLAGQFSVTAGAGYCLTESQYASLWAAAEAQGKSVYEDLLRVNRDSRVQEAERKKAGFAARRRLFERLGLPAVRVARLQQLEAEEHQWRQAMERRSRVVPELIPVAIAMVRGSREEQA